MTFSWHLVWPTSQGALPLSRCQKIGLRIVCVIPLLESHCASVFCDGINFDCVWLCCFYIWKREGETERNNNKRSWCLWIGHWFCCSWLYGPLFLIKTGKDMEACTAAQAKTVEVDGVCVDSRWQLKYLPWGLRDGLGAAGLLVIMTHPTECYYLKTVLGWNDIVMGWDFSHVFMALSALAQQLTSSFCVLFCLPYNCFFSAPCLFPCPSFSHSSLFFLVSAYMHYRDSLLCMHRFLAEYAEICSITFFVLPLTLKKLMCVCTSFSAPSTLTTEHMACLA